MGFWGFGSDNYNLVRRNCNHFCNALSWKLLRRPIPAYVNRLANIGECCSCLLPKQLLDDSPVGGSGNNQPTSFAVPTQASMNRGGGGSINTSSFAGKGHSLGGGGTASSSTTESTGLLSRWTANQTTTSSSGSGTDDLTDRRERARKAALARMERNQQTSQMPGSKES